MKTFLSFGPYLFRLLIALMMLSLMGCLVNEDSESTIKNRATDNFRLLQSGDYYDYLVFAQITPVGASPASVQGTLSVTYTQTTLPNPFSTGGIMSGPIFREYSTLTLGGSTYTVKRYVRQNTTTGALSVVAVRNGAFNDDNGTLYRIGQNSNLFTPLVVEILPSPVPGTSASNLSNFNYQYMSGCETVSPTCQRVEQTTSYVTVQYQGNADITSNVGRFNTLRVDYNGLFLGDVQPNTPLLFNIKGACDINNASFTQSDFIFPEVGVIFIDSTCTPLGGGGFNYTASLTNTNVPIP